MFSVIELVFKISYIRKTRTTPEKGICVLWITFVILKNSNAVIFANILNGDTLLYISAMQYNNTRTYCPLKSFCYLAFFTGWLTKHVMTGIMCPLFFTRSTVTLHLTICGIEWNIATDFFLKKAWRVCGEKNNLFQQTIAGNTC